MSQSNASDVGRYSYLPYSSSSPKILTKKGFSISHAVSEGFEEGEVSSSEVNEWMTNHMSSRNISSSLLYFICKIIPAAMRPCICSIRAFELFVKDVSGLPLRSSLPRPHVSSYQSRRRFGAIARLRTVEPAAASRINDGFVLFESEAARRESPSGSENANDGAKENWKAAQAKEEDLGDEWHAEIEIVAPWPEETKHPSTTDTNAVEDEHGGLDNIHHGRPEGQTLPFYNGTISIDEMSLQELDFEQDSVITTAQAPLLQPEPTVEPNSAQQRSRAENRQERKLRRLQAGTFRQEAEKRSEQRLANTQLSSVLSKIEAMEGATPEGVGARQRQSVPKATKSKSEAESKENTYANATLKSLSKKDAGKKPRSGVVSRTVITNESQTKANRGGWQVQKEALKSKFGEQGWQPRKRLSPDTLDGIRALHSSDPGSYTTQTLAEHFKVTPEAIRRILKSKWRPNAEEAEKRLKRWEKRGERKWTAMAAQGTRPPAKWRAKGIQTPQAERTRSSRRRENEYVGWEDQPGSNKRLSLSERIL